MNEVNFQEGLEAEDKGWQYPNEYLVPDILQGMEYSVNEIYKTDRVMVEKIIKLLERINMVLANSPFRIAYRVRNEILIYCACNKELIAPDTPLKQWLNRCLDEMIMMKILSRIEGNESRCATILNELLKIVTKEFPQSHQKIQQMKQQLTINSQTSFWN
jgi:hypothetical protein